MEEKDKNKRQGVMPAGSFHPVELLHNDRDFIFLFKKIEKLVAAVFMVTNLFSDSEEIRHSLRAKGINLMSLNTRLKDTNSSEQDITVAAIKSSVLEIMSLLSVAYFAGLMSEMNYSLLKTEFTSLIARMKGNPQINGRGGAVKIPHDFFFVQESVFAKSDKRQYQASLPEERGIGQTSSTGEGLLSKEGRVEVRKDMRSHAPNKRKVRSATKSDDKKKDRQNKILDILKQKDKVTVTDIAEIITNCSEKTIQRDLLSLVDEGVLRKEGERRWSTYMLV